MFSGTMLVKLLISTLNLQIGGNTGTHKYTQIACSILNDTPYSDRGLNTLSFRWVYIIEGVMVKDVKPNAWK